MSKLTDHNHVCNMARVVKWLLYEKLEEEFQRDLKQKPCEVRKRVVEQFKEEYQNQPEVLNEVESMNGDINIDRNLSALKHSLKHRSKKQSSWNKSMEHRANTRIEYIHDSSV